MGDHEAEIASEVMALLSAIGQLGAQALADGDPSKLRRAREVITGELCIEGVLRDGEAAAAILAGKPDGHR